MDSRRHRVWPASVEWAREQCTERRRDKLLGCRLGRIGVTSQEICQHHGTRKALSFRYRHIHIEITDSDNRGSATAANSPKPPTLLTQPTLW
ncbi:uncharacterized protein [Dermacentor albipictus]